jgi:hypothetical protein
LYTLDILFESCGAFCYGLFCCRREGKKSTCVFPSIKGKFIWKFRKPDCACCCVCACERASHFLTAFLKNSKKNEIPVSNALVCNGTCPGVITVFQMSACIRQGCLHIYTRAGHTNGRHYMCDHSDSTDTCIQVRLYKG